MKAFFGGTGLSIKLKKEDKNQTKLECIVQDYNNPKLNLYVVDEVKHRDTFEEPGFHMQCYPVDVSSRESTQIEVYLSKERWKQITTIYDPEAGGGWFGSRCMYDRCHIHYWDEDLYPKD